MTDTITLQERRAIDAWLASNQPKQCPPCRFTEDRPKKHYWGRYKRNTRPIKAITLDEARQIAANATPIETVCRMYGVGEQSVRRALRRADVLDEWEARQ